MDIGRHINSEADIKVLVDAYRLGVHGTLQQSQQILKEYPELERPITVTRAEYARDAQLGREWEHQAVEGIAEAAMDAFKQRPQPVPDLSTKSLFWQDAVVEAPPAAVCMDFGRVIHSVEDVRHLVDAYRLAMYGNEQAGRKVFDQFPELEPLVMRTRAYLQMEKLGGATGNWEDVAVEGMAERGLKILEEKGRSPFSQIAPRPEVSEEATPLDKLVAYVRSDASQLEPAQRAEIIKAILDNASQQHAADDKLCRH